jgi:hypothetical protein
MRITSTHGRTRLSWAKTIAAHVHAWHRWPVPLRHRHAIASLAALALAACQAPPSTTARAEQETDVVVPETISAQAPAETPQAKPTPPPLGSTRVYLVVGEQGDRIVRFDERGAASLPTTTTGAIADLFESEGAVHVRDQAALYRIEGEQLLEVLRFPAELGVVHHVALARDGSVWVAAESGIGTHTGDAWQLTPLAELGLDRTTKLAFDSEQSLWAVAPRQALYREGERWIPAQLELLAPEYTLLNPVGSPVGRVHVSNHHLLTRLGKTNFDSVVIDFKTRVSYTADLDIAPDGYACVATPSCDLACANATPPTIIWRFPGKDYACESLYEIGVEASHRVWVASSSGLSLILPERDVHEFTLAEYPALAGPVTHMVVQD